MPSVSGGRGPKMLTKCAYCGRALHPDNAYHGENKPGEDDGGELYCDEECYRFATDDEPKEGEG